MEYIFRENLLYRWGCGDHRIFDEGTRASDLMIKQCIERSQRTGVVSVPGMKPQIQRAHWNTAILSGLIPQQGGRGPLRTCYSDKFSRDARDRCAPLMPLKRCR